MTNYNTFTFKRKSHWNEFSPDINMKFTTHHSEDDLDAAIDMFASFLIACGYSENGIKSAMQEFAEE